MVKILILCLLFLSWTNALYFMLKKGESKCFDYDLTKKAVYVGEYFLLDDVPNLEATGDGVRVNFHEPENKQYYTKIFQKQDRQVFNVKTPGIHKICFEGTRNLYYAIDKVRVEVKMHDESKHEKKIEKALKSNDLQKSKDVLTEVGSVLASVGEKIKESQTHLDSFEDLQYQHDSNINWLAFFSIVVVAATAALEAYMFKRSMFGNNQVKMR